MSYLGQKNNSTTYSVVYPHTKEFRAEFILKTPYTLYRVNSSF